MNSNHNKKPIRVFGQRTLASFYGSLSSTGDSKKASGDERVSKKPMTSSLSDFFHCKLHKTSTQVGTVEGKSTPFLSPFDASRVPVDGNVGSQKQNEGQGNGNASENVVLDQFKHVDEGNGDFIGSYGVVEEANHNIDAMTVEELRRKGNPFLVEEKSKSRGNQVVVIGGDSQPRQKSKDVKFSGYDYVENGIKESNASRRNINIHGGLSQLKRKGRKEGLLRSKKQKSSYNHYENGSGWWDGDMEGVDNEELGFSEIWEGVGSTTLGGIEWH